MSQPTPFNRTTSFTNYQAANPSASLPGNSLDAELNNAKTTFDQILANLARIQRDDGALANASVGLAQLSPAVTVGFSVPTAWATGTGYVSSPASTVFNGGKFYSCLVSHTSGTFATDLAAAKWVLIADLTAIPLVTANQIAVTPSGMLTTDVQGSLQALDGGKAATSHTHVASAISNSTAAGRALLTAADLAAQQTLLGLGSLAFLNTLPTTTLATQFLLTGSISPAALNASTNDWAPTGMASAAVIRVTASTPLNVTGLAGGSDGRVIQLQCLAGSSPLTLTASDAASAAANRFLLPASYVLNANCTLTLIYDGTVARWRSWSATVTQPTQQVLTSGSSATYTTPAGCIRLRVRMVGGGGGGGSSAGAGGSGGAGGDTSFNSIVAKGGAGGLTSASGGTGGAGGTSGTGTASLRISGAAGATGFATAGAGAGGGVSLFGGAGAPVAAPNTGTSAATNSGSGGGGGAHASNGPGGGGGAGEYVEYTLSNPAATLTYSVGTAGTAGTAGGGNAGGAGGSGLIIVEEFYG